MKNGNWFSCLSRFLAMAILCSVWHFSSSIFSTELRADSHNEWHQWRGPNRDGISSETGLLQSWSNTGPKELWRVPIGEGFSGISVSGGRVYTMVAENGDEFVICLDASTGEELWRFRSDSLYLEGQGGNGPRATPTIDGDLLFTVSAYGKLYALNDNTGDKLWQHDFQSEYGSKMPRWGYSMSPLVKDGLLLVEVGGKGNRSIVAFDKTNGDEVWTSQSGVAGYSSPITINVNGVEQLIVFAGQQLISVSPTDGTLYWKYTWETGYDVNAATPVFVPPDKIFISSGYGKGAAVVQMKVFRESDDAKVRIQQLWKHKKMKNHFATSVYHDGYLYGFDNSILKCISADTGVEQWKKRGYGKGTLLLTDGHLIILSDKGKLALAEVNPEEFNEKASAKVLNGRCWTMPSLSGGKLYLRNDREMVCLDVAGQSSEQ